MIVRKRKARNKNDVQRGTDVIVSSIGRNSVTLTNSSSITDITTANTTSTRGDSATTLTQNSKSHSLINIAVIS